MKKYKLHVWALIGVLAMGVWTGCNKENPENQSLPKDGIAVNMTASVGTSSNLKVLNDQWQTADRLGVFMKKAGVAITAEDAVFENANNLLARVISGNIEWLAPPPHLCYPADGTKVDFVAYYPYINPVNADYTIDVDVANQTAELAADILYSNNAVNKEASEDVVPLVFKYSFAKIVTTVEAKEVNSLTVSLEGAFTKAKLQLSNGEFTGHQNKVPIAFKKTAGTGNTVSFEALILPAILSGSDEMVLVFNTGENEWRYKLNRAAYAAATQYEYHFKLIGQLDLVLLGSDITPRGTNQNAEIFGQKGTVTTICGLGNNADFSAGRFGIVNFRSPRYLAIDAKGNLYVAHNNTNMILKVDIEKHDVSSIFNASTVGTGNMPNMPCITPDGLIMFPADGNNAATNEVYYELDPKTDVVTQKTIIKNEEDPFTLYGYKHSLAYCTYDEKLYYRSSWEGALLRFDPETGMGEYATYEEDDEEAEDGVKKVRLFMQASGVTNNSNSTDGFLIFDKDKPYILYGALMNRHIIVSIDIRTGEEKILAGKQGTSGWVDGPCEEALFNNPRQMALDKDGNLIIAETNNHCIRKIDLATGIVSTIAGFPISGYRDGALDKAQFNQPYGVAVDPIDGSIYVGDGENRRIRKIWL